MNPETPGKEGASLHGGLLLAALAIVAIGMPAVAWPWYILLPLLIYEGITLALSPLRRTAPKLTLGRMNGAPLVCTVALSAFTVAVLIAFDALIRPDVTALAANLPASTFGDMIVIGVCFSFVNAALEEVIFRGILWEALAKEWNAAVALVATSVFFGLCHLNGYPPGSLGLYGVTLGLLRWWTGGLGLAVACHICADATIFSLLACSGAFGNSSD